MHTLCSIRPLNNAPLDHHTHEIIVSLFYQDTPGFVVNRLLIPYMSGAIQMLERGMLKILIVN